MAELLKHGREVSTVFELLGEHENDITFSIGWALAKCDQFLRAFLKQSLNSDVATDRAVIRLQEGEGEGGITDVEIESPGEFFIIVEAKRGWVLPQPSQLKKYADRHSFAASGAPTKRLVVLSECSEEYAGTHLPRVVKNTEVGAISYQRLVELAKTARPRSSQAQKRLLDELSFYLSGVIPMQNKDSNWVFVVSLGSGRPADGKISYIEVVEDKSRYFHPVGNRWPKEPPNYIAFRYGGRLRSIHHIETYKVITDVHGEIPELPHTNWEPHFLYNLGPGFCPQNEVRTGKIYQSARVWCMLDTLFTSRTISEARDISKQREGH